MGLARTPGGQCKVLCMLFRGLASIPLPPSFPGSRSSPSSSLPPPPHSFGDGSAMSTSPMESLCHNQQPLDAHGASPVHPLR